MAKTAGYTLGLTLSGFPGIDTTTLIIDSISITGDKQELVEVNDLCDTTMWRDYILGLKETGEISITTYGRPSVSLGDKGKVTIGNSSGTFSFADLPVIVTELPDIDTSKADPFKTTVKYKVLPTDSRLAATGATGTT